jgi:hypothetical protein
MTPEERQMLGGLFQRVNSAAATQRDPEAESFINDAVRTAPHAPYVLAQTVLVQQQALEAAANHISQLEAAAQQVPEQNEEHGSFLGNLGKSIFGSGPSSAPPRPDPDPQAYQRAAYLGAMAVAAAVSSAEQALPDSAVRALPAIRRKSRRSTTTTTTSLAAAATPISSSLIPVRRASRTPTSTTSTIRPSTILPLTTAAATTTSKDRLV